MHSASRTNRNPFLLFLLSHCSALLLFVCVFVYGVPVLLLRLWERRALLFRTDQKQTANGIDKEGVLMRGEEKAITTWAFFFRSGTRPVSSLQSSPPVFSSQFWSPPFLFGFTALFVCFVTDKHAVKTGGSASLCQRMEHTKRRVAYKCVCIVFLFNHGCAFVFEKEQLLPSFFSRQRIPLLLFLLLPSFFDTQAVECTYGDYTTVFQMFFLCECKVRENAGHPHRAQLLFKGFAARNE